MGERLSDLALIRKWVDAALVALDRGVNDALVPLLDAWINAGRPGLTTTGGEREACPCDEGVPYRCNVVHEDPPAESAEPPRGMNDGVTGHCRTNLDEYASEEWPTRFAALPREGDWVRAKSGKMLRVARVTHEMVGDRPRIEVALYPRELRGGR